jgi:signal peptidase I
MIPFLMLGDKVIVQKIQPESLKIGDLIVISRKNEFITHRLVRKGNRLWVTKGDHYHHFDPPVPKQAILGKVIVIDRKGQMINLQTNFWKGVNRFLGWENWIQGLIYRYLRAVKNQLRFTR